MQLKGKAIQMKSIVNSPTWEAKTDDEKIEMLQTLHAQYGQKGEVGYILKDVFIQGNLEKIIDLYKRQEDEEK